MRIAPEGWLYIALGWVVLGILAFTVHWWALLWLPIALWQTAFFRDPDRPGPRGEELIIAPADGKIVGIIPIEEPSFVRGQAIRVSIFMNVFDVHVNRYPGSGRLDYRFYSKGKFGHAMPEKASTENEQCSIGLETARGRLLIRQIAGSIARRIVTDHQVGTEVIQGERLGLIRYGSRVDLFLPAMGAEVLVQAGEKARAGLTVVARWK